MPATIARPQDAGTRGQADEPPRDSWAYRASSDRLEAGVAAGLIALGVVLVLGAATIASELAAVLPAAMTVRSAQWFPSFAVAMPFTLRGLGYVLIAATAVQVVAQWFRTRVGRVQVDSSNPIARLAPLLLVLAVTAVVYWQFATPHNASEGNARVHYTDLLFVKHERFFYTLGKVPHLLFYDHPNVLQTALGVLNVALVYAIGRQLLRNRWMPLLMACSYLWAGSMLLFADTADDVQLVVAALLAVLLAHLRRAPIPLALALLAAFLARGPLASAAIGVGIAELGGSLLAQRADGERLSLGRALRSNPVLSQALPLFGAIAVLWIGYLQVRGSSWLLGDGGAIDVTIWDLTPKSVEGFTIDRFSGAYLLHLLWVLPLPILLAHAALASRWREVPDAARRAVVAVWVMTAIGVAVSEVEPLAYFNVRYLTYYLPSLIATSWIIFTTRPAPGSRRHLLPGLLVALILAGSTAATFQGGIHHWNRSHPAVGDALWPVRFDMREAAGSGRVYTTITSTTWSNWLVYVLKRTYGPHLVPGEPDWPTIEVVKPGTLPPDGIVITDDPGAYPTAEVVLRADPFFVVRRADAG